MTPLYEVHLRAAAESYRAGDLLWATWLHGQAWSESPFGGNDAQDFTARVWLLECRNVIEREWDRIRRRAESADAHAAIRGSKDTGASPSRPEKGTPSPATGIPGA